MTVFKTFLKILNKNKFIVIMYTVILLVFGGFNMQNTESSINFVASKPDVMIINNDTDNKVTNNFIKYISDNCNVKDTYDSEDKINDALFYREINYVIYIPASYGDDYINGKNPKIEVKSTGDYMASLTEMIISRYNKVISVYMSFDLDIDTVLSKTNEILGVDTSVEITSKLDTNSLEQAAFFFNFESYSLLACLIYVICLLLSIFNNEKIRKRIIISSTDYKKHNRELLLSNCLYSVVIWLFYVVMGIILVGDVVLSTHGIFMIINSFIFMICATTIAFLLGSLVSNKDAINGIMNVVALGSSFLCGVFVPQSWLPDSVLVIARVLPTYYYVKANELLKTIEEFNIDTLSPVLINMFIVLIYSIIFIILTNYISSRKRKIG